MSYRYCAHLSQVLGKGNIVFPFSSEAQREALGKFPTSVVTEAGCKDESKAHSHLVSGSWTAFMSLSLSFLIRTTDSGWEGNIIKLCM